MNRQILNLVMACSIACTAVTSLQAQSFATTGTVPFAFHVGKTALPAGDYKFSQAFPDTYQTIRNQNTGRSILLTAGPGALTGTPAPRLVFHQYGEQYFLSEIWTIQGRGILLTVGATEQEARENFLSAKEAKVSVPLLAQR